MEKIIKEIEAYSRNHHKTHRPSFEHIKGVKQFAFKLAKGKKVDLEVLELAAYLHDIDRTNLSRHAALSAVKAKALLIKYDLPSKKLEKILNCIKAHHGQVKATCAEANILREADALELLQTRKLIKLLYYFWTITNDFDKGLNTYLSKMNDCFSRLKSKKAKKIAKKNFRYAYNLIKESGYAKKLKFKIKW